MMRGFGRRCSPRGLSVVAVGLLVTLVEFLPARHFVVAAEPPVAKRVDPANNPDFRPIRNGLFEQWKVTLRAEVQYNNAKLARQIAEIDLEQYRDQIFVKDFALAQGNVKLAETDLRRAEDRMDWAQRMFDKGFISAAQKASEELGLQKARFGVEQAASQYKFLGSTTQGKILKQLHSELEKAHSDELAKQQAWEAERKKLKAIEVLNAK